MSAESTGANPAEGGGPRQAPPTPVRAMMEPGAEAIRNEHESGPPTFTIGEEQWLATSAGSTRSGSAGDPGAPLLLVTFSRQEQPDVVLREAICVADSLAELSTNELAQLFSRSRVRPEAEKLQPQPHDAGTPDAVESPRAAQPPDALPSHGTAGTPDADIAPTDATAHDASG